MRKLRVFLWALNGSGRAVLQPAIEHGNTIEWRAKAPPYSKQQKLVQPVAVDTTSRDLAFGIWSLAFLIRPRTLAPDLPPS